MNSDKFFSWVGSLILALFVAIFTLHYEYDFLQKRKSKPNEEKSESQSSGEKRQVIKRDTTDGSLKKEAMYLLKDSFITDNEGNKYPLLKFRNLIWLGKNLNLNTSDSRCYGDKVENCNINGRLYFFASAKSACKSIGLGWRLPTDTEWKDLAMSYGGYKDLYPGYTWSIIPETHGNPSESYYSLAEDGVSNFNAQLGGSYQLDFVKHKEDFQFIGFLGEYWASNDKQSKYFVSFRFFNTKPGNLYRAKRDIDSDMFSCRCVRG